MKKNTIYITWAIRIIVSFLFLLSAVAKMYPIWSFEKQLVDLGVATWCQSHYIARLLLGLELAIGIAILLPHYLKRIVIPGTILLLVLFCTHLIIEMVKHGAMNGNCGCFGQLIPMTPLEAFTKNIFTIALLIYLWFKVSDLDKGFNRFIYPFACFLGSSLLVFILFPFAPCNKTTANSTNQVSDNYVFKTDDSNSQNTVLSADIIEDSILKVEPTQTLKDSSKILSKTPKIPINQNLKNTTNTTAAQTPVSTVRSKFANFTNFGSTTVNLDQGKKIVCMFAPGCDHCQAVAKELGKMSKQGGVPDIYILFMDEEAEKIPEFFKIAEANFPYIVLDIPQFWDLIGPGSSTPGVYYLQDGKLIKSYQGIDKEQFNALEFKGILKN